MDPYHKCVLIKGIAGITTAYAWQSLLLQATTVGFGIIVCERREHACIPLVGLSTRALGLQNEQNKAGFIDGGKERFRYINKIFPYVYKTLNTKCRYR